CTLADHYDPVVLRDIFVNVVADHLPIGGEALEIGSHLRRTGAAFGKLDALRTLRKRAENGVLGEEFHPVIEAFALALGPLPIGLFEFGDVFVLGRHDILLLCRRLAAARTCTRAPSAAEGGRRKSTAVHVCVPGARGGFTRTDYSSEI